MLTTRDHDQIEADAHADTLGRLRKAYPAIADELAELARARLAALGA